VEFVEQFVELIVDLEFVVMLQDIQPVDKSHVLRLPDVVVVLMVNIFHRLL
jgi:hypothetical protein